MNIKNRRNLTLTNLAAGTLRMETRKKMDYKYLERRLNEIRQQACFYGADRRG